MELYEAINILNDINFLSYPDRNSQYHRLCGRSMGKFLCRLL